MPTVESLVSYLATSVGVADQFEFSHASMKRSGEGSEGMTNRTSTLDKPLS